MIVANSLARWLETLKGHQPSFKLNKVKETQKRRYEVTSHFFLNSSTWERGHGTRITANEW